MPQIYVPLSLKPRPMAGIVVRASGPPAALASPIRTALRGVDPTVPVFNVYTMRESAQRDVWGYRFIGQLFAVFSTVALTLAAIGVYGVVMFSVAQRTHEIGVRMALGARQSDVLRMVLRHGMTLIVGGAAVAFRRRCS